MGHLAHMLLRLYLTFTFAFIDTEPSVISGLSVVLGLALLQEFFVGFSNFS